MKHAIARAHQANAYAERATVRELHAGLPLGYAVDAARQPPGFHTTHVPVPPGHGWADRLIRDASESHILGLAPTGAGKGRSLVIPFLLDYTGSMVVVDPKGEAAAVSARWRRRMGHHVRFCDPFGVLQSAHAEPWWGPHSINPMEVLLGDSTDLGDDCETLVELIVGELAGRQLDPFWTNLAKELLKALIGWVWMRPALTGEATPGDRTFTGVWRLLTTGDLAYELAVLADKYEDDPRVPRFIIEGIVTFLSHEREKVQTSVRSEAVSQFRIFGSERVQKATAGTDVPLHHLRDGDAPVTLYLVIPPDRLQSHAPLLRILIGTLMVVMTRRRARPAQPTLFVVDELGHLGPIPQLKQSITLLRGYGVRVAMLLQSIAQLKGMWPQDYETILENCGTWLTWGATSLTAARKVADHLGDINAEALFHMGRDQLAIHQAGQPTRFARRLDYLNDRLFAGRFDANPMYERPAAHRSS